MSDRVALLFDGTLHQVGTPREVYCRPVDRQVADYFGNCVYIPGRVADGNFAGGGISCPAAVPAGEYVLMLRPDCLDTEKSGDYRLAVEEISFRGSDTQVSFRAEDGTLWKKGFHETVDWKIGERLAVQLNLTEPVLYPLE